MNIHKIRQFRQIIQAVNEANVISAEDIDFLVQVYYRELSRETDYTIALNWEQDELLVRGFTPHDCYYIPRVQLPESLRQTLRNVGDGYKPPIEFFAVVEAWISAGKVELTAKQVSEIVEVKSK